MWRLAQPVDDDRIVKMCQDLYREDPGTTSVSPASIRRTLETLRREPRRGRAVVLDVAGQVEGYAFLVAFWANGVGGEVCEVDELFVAPEHRRRGHGRALFEAIDRAEIWPEPPAAIALGVSAGNPDARRLYERLGFKAAGTTMVRTR